MLWIVIFASFAYGVDSGVGKYKFDNSCFTLNCKSNGEVCGIRSEGEGFRLRLFQDECALLNYKCAVKDNIGYEVTDMNYCSHPFRRKPDIEPSEHDPCSKYDCLHRADDVQECGLRRDGAGFRIRTFRNKCELQEHNCLNNVNFTITDFYICKGLELPATTEENKHLRTINNSFKNIVTGEVFNESEKQDVANDKDAPSIVEDTDYNLEKPNADNATLDDDFYIAYDVDSIDLTSRNLNLNNEYTTVNYLTKESLNQSNVAEDDESNAKLGPDPEMEPEAINDNIGENNDTFKKIVVVRGLLPDPSLVNETINRFFAATHVFDLPVEEITNTLNEITRRRLITIARPIKVYIPSRIIPQNTSDDIEHEPTLFSCFHKCPRKCPPTYAPVCGMPGRKAREPTMMFLNHCFMDVAQCKQFWEQKSSTSKSSSYSETTFVFCLGDAMNHMYHFLPLVKTLQHMGRLPRKGRFRYRLSNLKFFNNLLSIKNPNLMG